MNNKSQLMEKCFINIYLNRFSVKLIRFRNIFSFLSRIRFLPDGFGYNAARVCLSESAYASKCCISTALCGAADDAGSAASGFLCLSGRRYLTEEEFWDKSCKCICHSLFRVLELFLRFEYSPKGTIRLCRVLDPPEL